MKTRSLRTRLIVIILVPLLFISVIATIWQFQNTTKRAEDIFDRGLLSAALAISRDVALSGGDALSPGTRNIVSDTSGGELFYHVFAPDGVFVTGYATPPISPDTLSNAQAVSTYYDAVYQASDVRVLRFQDATIIDGIAGLFTITVWQATNVRTSFIRDVVLRAVAVISLMVLSVAGVVWFGVGYGLRPLLDLQEAISRRSASELEPIRRDVPVEVQGIVKTLNKLLDRVSRRISSKDEFISNAAHQLRNPIAGILALAEAVESAPSAEAAKSRSTELVSAARDATHLTNQLLSFERAVGEGPLNQNLDLEEVVANCVTRMEQQSSAAGVKISFEPIDQPLFIRGDAIMLQEAILNLLTNSIVHGGSELSQIKISTWRNKSTALVSFEDNGCGIDPSKIDLVMARFIQADAGPGSGLGLPIAARVIEHHSGLLKLDTRSIGLKATITLPLSET